MGFEKKSHQVGGYTKYFFPLQHLCLNFLLFKDSFLHFYSLASICDHLAMVTGLRVDYVT